VEVAASYADGTPAVISRQVGEGHTVYLNCLLPKYDPVAVEMVRGLLEDAGIARRVVVDSGDPDELARAWECAEYELGEARIVGLIRDHRLTEGPQTCQVRLGTPAHLYDMRAREYLGEGGATTVTLGRGETAMLALLPYIVTGITIAGDGTAQRVEIEAAGEITDHVLHVTVRDPDGNLASAYTRNVAAPRGVADLHIPLALSDPAGRWTLTVGDVLSGVERSAGFDWTPGG
jgi:hypothetical protein